MSNIWITVCEVEFPEMVPPSPRHETFILAPKCFSGGAAGQLQEIGECRKVYVASKHLLFHPLCDELCKERPSSPQSPPSLWMPSNSRLYIIWYETLWRLWRGCSRPQTVAFTRSDSSWHIYLQLQHPLSGVSSAALTWHWSMNLLKGKLLSPS